MIGWLRDVAKALDRVTRQPLEFLRRRAIRNAAMERLRENENMDQVDQQGEK